MSDSIADILPGVQRILVRRLGGRCAAARALRQLADELDAEQAREDAKAAGNVIDIMERMEERQR